ncbi:unnamed protein product [Cyprideis torosa]|uniref:DnaJ homolog subfamily C member 21 n=1 Tax=Cyprideis torosa TaxID=163714 RepID=A0A7R8ZJX8_9CRUS|nr:unnamed protein product [Cyprideis torosa]CAG0883256.1 unnamed protein product [Cyprideis torosa]
MRCHYEVLEVKRDAEDEEIKKSYRKLALKWHPDKNIENPDEAKRQFQAIQLAYDVLSDPQERAFYDRHREAIIRGGADGEYQDKSLDVFQYFNTSCFAGYEDEEFGFFAVYRKVFDDIIAEDSEFMDSDDEKQIPGFGNSSSDYEEVVHTFYAHWQSYCTPKSYSWLDQYDLRQAGHRQKLLEETKAENARRTQEHRARQLEERRRQLAEYQEADWTKLKDEDVRGVEAAVDREFGGDCAVTGEGSGSEEEISAFFCVACDKEFKNEKAFANHEKSRRHKENVALIRELLEEEEREDLGEELEQKCSITKENDEGEDLSPAEEQEERQKKRKKKKKKPRPGVPVELEDHYSGDDAQVNAEPKDDTAQVNAEPEDDAAQENEIVVCTNDVASNGVKEESADREDGDAEEHKKSKGKKAKEARRKAKEQGVEKPSSQTATDPSAPLCAKCKAVFPTKNKLFEHLKKTGHAVPLPACSSGGVKKLCVNEEGETSRGKRRNRR